MKCGEFYRCGMDGNIYLVVRRANVDYALLSIHDGQTIWTNALTLEKLHSKTCYDELTKLTDKISVENGLTLH